MKKFMWIVSFVPIIVTSFVLQFFPEQVPMHYDLNGNIDRWGNRTEKLLFPMVILGLALFWTLFIRYYEKKAVKATNDKERQEAEANAKVLGIVGLSMAVMESIMHFVFLYTAYIEANIGASRAEVDTTKILCLALGLFLVVIGNFMPKAKSNGVVGFRTTWSMHNDTTWSKSNRFAAKAIMAAGLLTMVTTLFVDGNMSIVMMLIYIVIAAIVSVAYSKKVYDAEQK